MKAGWPLAVSVAVVGYGCAMKETKVAVDQTPPAVHATIQRELVGAELEDIAKRTMNGQTVYETDLIRGGHKWEVIIREDGTILSKVQEEAVAQGAAKSNSAQSGGVWRDRFDVSKTDLVPTGTNPYITMQPGRVLKLKSGIDTLTVTILPDTQDIDGVDDRRSSRSARRRTASSSKSRAISSRPTRTRATSTTSARTWTTTRTARSSATRARGAPAREARGSV